MTQRRPSRAKNKTAERIAVVASKLNMGNTYDSPPLYYYDLEFTCIDCASPETWTAAQQKWWYEDIGAYFFSNAVRCRKCRELERERKTAARRAAGHAPAD